MKKVKILFFGRLSESAGREVDLEIPPEGCTVAELRSRLAEALPQAAADLAKLSIRACVEHEMVGEQSLVREGQEVAFVPPLSGG